MEQFVAITISNSSRVLISVRPRPTPGFLHEVLLARYIELPSNYITRSNFRYRCFLLTCPYRHSRFSRPSSPIVAGSSRYSLISFDKFFRISLTLSPVPMSTFILTANDRRCSAFPRSSFDRVEIVWESSLVETLFDSTELYQTKDLPILDGRSNKFNEEQSRLD